MFNCSTAKAITDQCLVSRLECSTHVSSRADVIVGGEQAGKTQRTSAKEAIYYTMNHELECLTLKIVISS